MWPMLMMSLTFGVIAPASHHAQTARAEMNTATFINDVRDSKGLAALAPSSSLAAAARRHSRQMAAAGRIFHSASFKSIAPRWRLVGENVGMGSTADDVFAYFMESPEHKANILDRSFTAAGVGIVESDGTYFVTVLFGGT